MAKVVVEVANGQNAEQVLASIRGNLVSLGDSVRVLNDDQRRLEATNRAVEARFRSLAGSLDPAIAKTNELSRAERTLGSALSRNLIDQAEHDRLLGLARDKAAASGGAMASLGARYFSTAAAIGAATTIGYKFLDFLGSSIEEASEAERIQRQIEAAITSTGGAAGLSSGQISDMADELSRLSTFDDDAILRMQSVLLTFTNIRGDNFRAASEAVLDLATRMGTDLQSAAVMVGKALQDPERGVTALTRAGVSFSAQQKELIADLVATGREGEAVQLILAELNRQFGGSAAADLDTYAGRVTALGNAWSNYREVVGGVVTESGLVNSVLAKGAEVLNYYAAVLKASGNEELSWETRTKALGQALRGDFAGALATMQGGAESARVTVRTLDDAMKNMAETEGISEAAMDAATAAMLRQSAEAEKNEKALAALLDRLLPLRSSLAEVETAQNLLAAAWASGSISAGVYGQALDALDEKLASLGQLPLQEPVPIEFEPVVSDERIQAEAARAAAELQAAVDALDASGGIPDAATFGETFQQILTPQLDEAAGYFSASMESGMMRAGATFLQELTVDADAAWDHLGQNLTAVLVQSVAEWLVEMLAAIAKAALAARAIQASSGVPGGGASGLASAAGGLGGAGGWASSAGSWFMSGAGSGGAASLATVAWAAAAVGAVLAITKMFKDNADDAKYGTRVIGEFEENAGFYAQAMGRLQVTGAAVATGLEMTVRELAAASGSVLESLPEIEIQIRNDREKFNVWIGEQWLGQFTDIQQAVAAAAVAAFQQADFATELEPALRDVIANFEGSDPSQLIDALREVRAVMDEVSGLSEVEIQLRDLDGAAAALQDRLVSLGVSFTEASGLAEQWALRQLASARDVITGQGQSEAEQRAIFEQQRALWNAKRDLMLAEARMDLQAVDAKIATLQAGGQLLSADLIAQGNYLQAKADIYNQSWNLEEQNLEVLAASNGISLELLQAQRAALAEMVSALEAMPHIEIGEFKPRGSGRSGGGGAVSTGPSREEQVAAILEEIESFASSLGSGDFASQLAAINARFDEWRERLAAVGEEVVDLGLLQQRALDELGDSIVDSLGLGSREAVAEIERLGASLEFLREHAIELGIATEELAAIQAEVSDQIYLDLLGGIARLIDDQETLQELEEIRYDLAKGYFALEIERAAALGLLTDEQVRRLRDALASLPEDLPRGGGSGSGGHGGYDPRESERERLERERLEEQRRLIAALEDLADLQRDLWASDLSPLNAEQQVDYLSGQISDAYSEAMRTRDPEAIARFQSLIRDYLTSYQEAYGSTGAGYTTEFLRLNEMINTLLSLGGITGITPGPGILGGGGTGGGGLSTGGNGGRNDTSPFGTGGGTVVPFVRSGAPSSPFVVESPSLVAELQILNRRLEAVERSTGQTVTKLEDARRDAAKRAFLEMTKRPVGYTIMSARPRVS